jgi:hypothetical protein
VCWSRNCVFEVFVCLSKKCMSDFLALKMILNNTIDSGSNSEKSALWLIPRALLCLVFEFLPCAEQLRLSFVCKRFRRAIEEDEVFRGRLSCEYLLRPRSLDKFTAGLDCEERWESKLYFSKLGSVVRQSLQRAE